LERAEKGEGGKKGSSLTKRKGCGINNIRLGRGRTLTVEE
jgi:hypothetical protein